MEAETVAAGATLAAVAGKNKHHCYQLFTLGPPLLLHTNAINNKKRYDSLSSSLSSLPLALTLHTDMEDIDDPFWHEQDQVLLIH